MTDDNPPDENLPPKPKLPAKRKRTPSRLPSSEDAITGRMRRMMNAMIYEDASLEEAAAAAGFRLRRARALLQDQVFMGEFRKLTVALRSGAAAAAVNRIIELMNNPGAGTAADRTVQLKAARSVLGEDSRGVNVNISNINKIDNQITPGYVLNLLPDPWELPKDHPDYRPRTIDVTPQVHQPVERSMPNGGVMPAEKAQPAQAAKPNSNEKQLVEFSQADLSRLSSDELIRRANPGAYGLTYEDDE